MARKILDEVINLISRKTKELAQNIKKVLLSSDVKEKNQEEIAKVAKRSLRERLAEAKVEADALNSSRSIEKHKRDWGER